MNTTKGYVDAQFLNTVGTVITNIKQQSYKAMNVKLADTVLDLGCGPGIDTIALADIVKLDGKVIGVDYDKRMVAKAEGFALAAGVSDTVKHYQGNAVDLSFDDNSFDSCRSERLFQHLPNPAQALAEMVRVTKPGGKIVVVDTDWGTLSIDSGEDNIERKLTNLMVQSFITNAFSGRTLYRLFNDLQLKYIYYETFPIVTTNYSLARYGAQLDRLEQLAIKNNIITEDELSKWHHSLNNAAEAGTFFSTVNMTMLVGCKR